MHDLFAGNATVASWSIRVLHTVFSAHLCLALSRHYPVCHALDCDPVNTTRGCAKLMIVDNDCSHRLSSLTVAIGISP